MKILTLNTHSLIEDDYEKKCEIFAKAVCNENIDILLLQEVNQSAKSQTTTSPHGYSIGKVPLKKDNHAITICNLAEEFGANYNFVWLGIKSGFAQYDEGLGIMSKKPIEKAVEIPLSKSDDYTNWKTRKALLVRTCDKWICNTHMGWWEDKEEPFENQFDKLCNALSPYPGVILGGDFNCPDSEHDGGYDLVLSKGWHDTYKDAKEKNGHATINGKIAGWETNTQGIRVDYIFTKQKANIPRTYTVFDSYNYDIVSDHFGMISEFSEV